jgi:hypothetical protein
MTDGPHVSFAPLTESERDHWAACPEIGTMACLRCEHAGRIARYDCHYECHRCWKALTCPCSRDGWEQRQPTACAEKKDVL